MRILGWLAWAASLSLCGLSGLVLVPSCAPMGGLGELPRLSRGLDFEGGVSLTYEVLVPEGVDPDGATRQVVEVVRSRLSDLGSPATVFAQGEQVRIEIAGTDPETLGATRGVIGRSTTLEVRLVDDASSAIEALGPLPPGVSRQTETVTAFGGLPGGSLATSYLEASGPTARGALERLIAAAPPGDRDILLGRAARYDPYDAPATEPTFRTYVVHREAHVDGSDVADAHVASDPQTHRPVVFLELDDAGREAFARMTTDAVGRRIAIVVDGEVMSAPVVQEPITAGRAQITFGHHVGYDELLQEANDLVLVLRSGALPAPLRLVDERIVEATYGESVLGWLAVASILSLALVVAAGGLRYRAGTLLLAAPLPIVIAGLAALALLEGTVTAAAIGGIGLAAAASLITSVLVAERIRRPDPTVLRRVVDAALVPVALLLLATAGGVLFAATSGMAKGFATGLFVTAAAGLLPSLLWCGGLTAALRRSDPPDAGASGGTP